MESADVTSRTTAGAGSPVEHTGPRTPALPRHLRLWIAKTLAEGWSTTAVIRKLVELGHDEQMGRAEILEVTATPGYAAAVELARSRDKLASLLDTLGHQLRRSSAAREVPVLEGTGPEEFFDRYYYGNRPVVVRSLMADWPALQKWSPEWLRSTYGDVPVEVATGRDGDERFEDNFDAHRTLMPLEEFITSITGSSGNDLYLVSKNRLLDQDEFAALLDDFHAPAGYLRPGATATPGFWLGPGGTKTPLHHDSTNIFFGQVFGSKRIRLVPPVETGSVYNDRACYSAVDLDAPDLVRFPRLAEVAVLDVTVGPGDFLLIPVGWWHTVTSLSPSISMSFHNFATAESPVVWQWRRAATGSRSSRF